MNHYLSIRETTLENKHFQTHYKKLFLVWFHRKYLILSKRYALELQEYSYLL